MTVQHSRLVQRRGVEYLIRVERVEGGSSGTWFCLKCHRFGILPPSEATLDELAEAAADQADRDHGAVHVQRIGAA